MDEEIGDAAQMASVERFGLLLPIAALLTGLVVAVVVVASLAADAQDRQAVVGERHTLQSVMTASAGELGGWVSDYSYWDDFVTNVVITRDEAWIDGNIGTYAHENLNVDVSLVVAGGDEAYLTLVAEESALDGLFSPLPPELLRLAVKAGALGGVSGVRPIATSAYLKIAGRVFVAAASRAKRESDEAALPELDGAPVVLIYLRQIDGGYLASVSNSYMIKDLALVDDIEPRDDALPLNDPDGRVVAQLTWRSPAPGTEFLRELLLPMGGVLVVAGLVVVFIVQRVRRSAHRLVEAHRILNDRTAALREARDEADRANRAKTEFLAQMSHDLRTPLNAILGFSEVIALQAFGSNDEAGERYRDYARQIHRGGAHLRVLIDSILDVARLDSGRYELRAGSVDFDDLVSTCVAMLHDDIKAGEFTVLTPPTGMVLRVDGSGLEQVLLNLIGNAIKYSARGGTITVAAELVAGEVEVSIADTGAGMTPDDIRAAFDLFSRGSALLARPTQGAGIGLNIVKRLVELHGGSVRIESEIDRGTKVICRFPSTVVERAAL